MIARRPRIEDFAHIEGDPVEVKSKRGNVTVMATPAQVEHARAVVNWNRIKAASDRHALHVRLGLNVREIAPSRDPGTPETQKKLKVDVIAAMLGRDQITRAHADAADEIESVVMSLTRGLMSGSHALDGTRVDGTRKYRDPIDRMTNEESRQWSRHYVPWSKEMQGVRYQGRHEYVTALDLTVLAVVHNNSMNAIDKSFGLRNGTAGKALRDALWRYAEVAGMVRPTRKPHAKKTLDDAGTPRA